jgi:hypothetical protein
MRRARRPRAHLISLRLSLNPRLRAARYAAVLKESLEGADGDGDGLGFGAVSDLGRQLLDAYAAHYGITPPQVAASHSFVGQRRLGLRV